MTASDDPRARVEESAPRFPSTRFSRLRLSGGRYDDAGFPIEGLDELIVYERLVLEVARSIWKRDHPHRKRVPNNFENALSLKLTQINPGSTIPQIERAGEWAYLPDVDALGLIDQAQDAVDEAFNEIVERNALPAGFPRSLQGLLTRVGATLRDDEGIQFGPQERTRRARYTQPIRRNFLRGSNPSFKRPGSLAGRIIALDTEQLHLTIQTLSGRSISGTYVEDEMTEDFLQVFNAPAKAPIVRLDGVLEYDARSAVKSFAEVERILVLDLGGDRHRLRFEQLLALEDGWNGPDSHSPDFFAIERAIAVLDRLDHTPLPAPGIFALPDGGVQLEWMNEEEIWGIDILLDGDELEVSIVDVSSQSAQELTTVSADDAVEFLVDHMGRHP